MLLAVKNHPESYLGRWRKYSVDYAGEVFDSAWEVAVKRYFDSHGVKSKRSLKGRFEYWHEEKFRTYTPDFYLPEYKVYVEVKGFITDKDVAKWGQFPSNKRLLVITGASIRRMLNGAKLGLIRKVMETQDRLLIDGVPLDVRNLSVHELRTKSKPAPLSKEERSRILKEALARSPKVQAIRKRSAERKSREQANLHASYKGDRNSQYASFWITDGRSNRKWKEEYGPVPNSYRRGRTM